MIKDPHLLFSFSNVLKKGWKLHRKLLQASKNYASYWTKNSAYPKKMFTRVEYSPASTIYYLCDKVHRDDLPAFIDYSGTNYWYTHGKLHRAHDLPAVESTSGNKLWYSHGVVHRANDLPAIEWCNGNKEWYLHGKRHRGSTLPAVIRACGEKQWWKNGLRYMP